MMIACTIAAGRGETDLLLAGVAERLMARGRRVRGIVQVNTECDTDGPCDMDVRVLPDGPTIRISQSLGKDARGCRLDPAALETAVGRVEASLAGGADLLIVNKFGKHEADGHGFRDLLARAAVQGIPVLVGLNGLNRQAFEDFAGDLSIELAPTPEALVDWAMSVSPDAPQGRERPTQSGGGAGRQ